MPRLHRLAVGFGLRELPPAPPLAAAVEARITAIWAEETRRRGKALFNGRIYGLVEHAPDRLGVRAMEYRHLVARRHAPELVDQGLDIRPLGVTALLVSPDGVVLGRRAGHVADAGFWETAPSGSLDRLDPAGVLIAELAEELGLPPDSVGPPQPLALAEDGASGVFDIVFRLDTTLDEAAIRAAQGASESGEYDALAVVAPSELAGFLATHAGAVLPIVPAILRRAGLLAA